MKLYGNVVLVSEGIGAVMTVTPISSWMNSSKLNKKGVNIHV